MDLPPFVSCNLQATGLDSNCKLQQLLPNRPHRPGLKRSKPNLATGGKRPNPQIVFAGKDYSSQAGAVIRKNFHHGPVEKDVQLQRLFIGQQFKGNCGACHFKLMTVVTDASFMLAVVGPAHFQTETLRVARLELGEDFQSVALPRLDELGGTAQSAFCEFGFLTPQLLEFRRWFLPQLII